MKGIMRPVVLVAGLAAVPFALVAHFRLLEPAEWVKTNELGDPQKVGPCGGDPHGNNENLLTNASTKVSGGSKLHLKIQETIYHAGHYRVALAVNSRTDLPPDPIVTERWTDAGVFSTWAQVQSPPQIPVLVDGLFPHYPKPGEPASKRIDPNSPLIWETDVDMPNINCPRCILQVVEFMADHPYNIPGGYSYHHCAVLEITANPAKPIDKRWPTAAGEK